MALSHDVTAWHAIPTSTWSDALDRARIDGVIRGLAWRSGAPRLEGRAVTVREDVGELGDHPPAAFDVPAMLQSAGPGDVLVVQMAGAEVSSFGGLVARAAAARHIEGVLVDGGCRDLDEIREVGFRVWSRHVTPISGKGRIRIAGINEPIACGGVRVAPGDYIVADQTGAVVVPAARFAEVLAIAEELENRDQAFARALDAGQEFGAVAASLGHV